MYIYLYENCVNVYVYTGMAMIFAAQISFSAGATLYLFIGDRVPSLQSTVCRFWMQATISQKNKKVLCVVTLYRQFTMALTFQNVCQGAVAVLSICIRKQGRLGEIKTWMGTHSQESSIYSNFI